MSSLPEARSDREGFRLRGREVNRLEAFSDVVFGFALTLLGISIEVPHTYGELIERLRGLPVFAVCFAILVLFWYEHYRFFRRYDLQDAATVTLNAVLLGLLLSYVYPLKFVFSLAIARDANAMMTPTQVPALMVIYAAGFSAVWGVFAALYAHALRVREPLRLNRLELFETRRLLWRAVLQMGIGLVALVAALVVAAVADPGYAGLTGFVYALLGPAISLYEAAAARRRKRLRSLGAAV